MCDPIKGCYEPPVAFIENRDTPEKKREIISGLLKKVEKKEDYEAEG
ncbi:hypothetical protein ACFLW6_04960 [Chloroflexota bacterium]